MKTKLLTLIALTLATSLFGQVEKPIKDLKPDYIVTIEKGEMKVFDYTKPDQWLGRVKVEDWAKALGRLQTSTRNDKRHLALNGAAAVVAGVRGGRDHTIDSLEQIVSMEDSHKTGKPITLTIESGTGFAIRDDATDAKGNYRAEILMLSAKKLQEATSVKP